VTPDESLVTVAVNCIVCPLPTNAAWGETATVTGPLSEELQPTRQKRKDTQQTSRGNLPDVVICFFRTKNLEGAGPRSVVPQPTAEELDFADRSIYG
jgi:hypothetical protein